jgi:hypothetical protein
VRIFKIPWFARFAAKEGITDKELKAIVHEALETGQAEASLYSKRNPDRDSLGDQK